MTGQLLKIIEEKNYQTEVVQLVYSTSAEKESNKLPDVSICLEMSFTLTLVEEKLKRLENINFLLNKSFNIYFRMT